MNFFCAYKHSQFFLILVKTELKLTSRGRNQTYERETKPSLTQLYGGEGEALSSEHPAAVYGFRGEAGHLQRIAVSGEGS